MKKILIKLVILGVGIVYLFNPQNISGIKNNIEEMMNRPFIQFQQEINNLMECK